MVFEVQAKLMDFFFFLPTFHVNFKKVAFFAPISNLTGGKKKKKNHQKNPPPGGGQPFLLGQQVGFC